MTEEELQKLREWSRTVIDALKATGIRARVELPPPGDVLSLFSLPTGLPFGFQPYRTQTETQAILGDRNGMMEKVINDHMGWWADVNPDRS